MKKDYKRPMSNHISMRQSIGRQVRAGLMGLLLATLGVAASAQGLDASGALLLLAAGLVVALVLAPLTIAAAIRIAMS